MKITGRQRLACLQAQWRKEVVVGTLSTLYTAENIQDEEFNPAEFNLGEELFSAVDETAEPERHLQP